MQEMRRMWRFNGLTLIEVLVAVVILAVLAGLGLPALNAYSDRAYRAEAQGDLVACALALERWAGVRFTYQGTADTDADGAGDADDGPIATEVCASRSVAEGRYRIRIAASAEGFALTAHPEAGSPMVGDGFLTLDEAGNRGWDRNDDGELVAEENGWE
ncbi:MAG: prepilin-type N-terminal cleavage/methylation domain-containing protein [Gammaproteobacteria bacterium]|nr:prepilin-type N-terminal cleavage/methylation domain-containing protein [Gammaproteobacteria bacterium]